METGQKQKQNTTQLKTFKILIMQFPDIIKYNK